MLSDMHLITIQYGAQDVQKDMIADLNVPTVGAVERGLNV